MQYWTGSNWATVPGGSITGNNLVWRKINFAAITTSKIRVVNAAATDGVARIAEVEAWAASSGGTESSANVQWLVTDHLGTPRDLNKSNEQNSSANQEQQSQQGEDKGKRRASSKASNQVRGSNRVGRMSRRKHPEAVERRNQEVTREWD